MPNNDEAQIVLMSFVWYLLYIIVYEISFEQLNSIDFPKNPLDYIILLVYVHSNIYLFTSMLKRVD